MIASELHALPADDEPPVRYRVSVNVTGPGFDIDVMVDGLPTLGSKLQEAILTVVEVAAGADGEAAS